MTWELMAFEESCLQKAGGQEPQPSPRECTHLAQMKDRPANEMEMKAREERRKTRGRTRRTLQKQEDHSLLQ